jgi:NAD(P)-dependent dehydrogenase (short-subunit alcohol dehydrogenase family)
MRSGAFVTVTQIAGVAHRSVIPVSVAELHRSRPLHTGVPSTGPGASKGALRLFTQSLALELARDGIRVNGVAPAFVESAMGRPAP